MTPNPTQSSKIRCQHMNFKVGAKVTRLTDIDSGSVTGFTTDITVNCTDCSMPFQWMGLDRGVSLIKPMVSFNGLELRAPIIPLEEL